jgi:phenylpropionate dioxygenase-like ring-hydroxylating dioxygenase large terminal subunit
MLPPQEAAKLRGFGPLSAKPYYDPDRWELERKAIFMRTWLHIGHVCELPEPGSFIRREVEFARASLIITRGRDGIVRTFHNACTHRGTQLVQENCGKASKFSCPYHMWTFGTDGKLLSAPDFERFHVEKEDVGLKQVATDVVAGMIFINFDPAPQEGLREFLGPVADGLELLPVARAVDFTEWTYEIAANWKTTFDNFQENYHLRFIHPASYEPTAGPDNPFGYASHYGFSGPHRGQILTMNPNPPPPAPILVQGLLPGKALAEEDGIEFPKTDFKIFPCLHLVGLPPLQQFTQTMFPLGPERTRSVVRMYWPRKVDSATRLFFQEIAANTLRDVLTEDRQSIEAAQRGLSSGAIELIHLQDHEMLLRHLYEEVEARVQAYVAETMLKGASA